jgi:hypothetical protein
MTRFDIGDAILAYGEHLLKEYIEALRIIMRNPNAELSYQQRQDWGEAVEVFRTLSREDQMIVIRSAELRLKRRKTGRTPRQSQ